MSFNQVFCKGQFINLIQRLQLFQLICMSLQSRYRAARESNCNQNYLNFIKKNQLLIHNELQGSKSPKNYQKSSISSFNMNEIKPDQAFNEDNNQNNRTFHSSLPKFQLESNLNQVSKIYGISINRSNRERDSPFAVGSQEQTSALIQMRTRHAKHQAAKELILSSHKSKSRETKRSNAKQSTQRYKPNLQVNVNNEQNYLFPSIQKKSLTTFVSETIKDEASLDAFRSEIRDRMNSLLHKTQQKRQISDQKMKSKEQITISNRFRMRQELYGLLPVFRTPLITFNGSKTKNMHSNHKGDNNKSEMEKSASSKETIQHFLEHNVTSKKLLIEKSKQIMSQSNIQLQNNPIQQEIIERKEQVMEQSSKTHKDKKKQSSLTQMKNEGELTIYELKVRSYRQFLFMVNLAHRIFDPISLKDTNLFKPEHRYKYYLGKGNNYLLVKSLLKRRFWWTPEQDPKKANFVWTQLKVNYFYQFQRKSYAQSKHYKLDSDFQIDKHQKKRKGKVSQQQIPQKAGVFKAPLPPNDKKIFTNSDKYYYDEYLEKSENPQRLHKFWNRLKYFPQNLLRQRACENIKDERVHNHLEYNYFIGNKKALFYNLKQYYDIQQKDVFDIIPLTYHIKHGTTDPQYEAFTKEFKRIAKQKGSKHASKNIWIVKPGELSNRGQGITVIDEVYELNNILKKKQKHFNGSEKTYIVQKYIEKPLLYKNRKFDIRHYMMISRLHGVMRAYWFGQGYIRTSSYQFKIDQISESIIHLTNDAIQKHCEGYGKYQEGNKVSYNQFQRYMDSTYGEGKFSFSEMIYPKMKAIALDAVKATYLQLDPNNAQHNFQIFGLDFMIDTNYNVWLIEVNTNPCLELSSKLLARLIPNMVQHSLRLTLDVIFPPPSHYPNSQKYLAPDDPLGRLQFELIFDENRDGKEVEELFSGIKKLDMGQVDEQDETYENDGKEIELNNQQIQ